MLTTDTLLFGQMTHGEIRGLRALARKSRALERLGPMLARVQYFLVLLGPSLEAEAAEGLARMETDLLLRIAARPADDIAQLRIKAMLVRCRTTTGDHVGAMFSTAVEADGQRLGVSPALLRAWDEGLET